MYIGQAAKLSGASIKAIRHYDKIGLISEVRRMGSYRVFSERDVNLIKLIKQAQELGFKLSELKSALDSVNGAFSWRHVQQLIREKQAQVEGEVTILTERLQKLHNYSQKIDRCLSGDPDCQGPLE